MEVVMVEFPVGSDATDECVAALEQLTTSVVAKQPKFHGATVHIETATGTVINIMQWEKASDFIEFRDANQDIIGPVLGKYGPKGRMLTVACRIAAQH